MPIAPEPPVFVLGTAQSDFARHLSRDGGDLFSLMREVTFDALKDAGVEPAQVDAAHVGAFTTELFAHQGHLGGFFGSMDEGFVGVAAARHEAACASGSAAILAATAALASGRADLALVVGVEQMRNVSGREAAEHLGVAAFAGREAEGARYVWPHLFARLADFYAERHGVDEAALFAWSRQMFANARENPLAQTRAWTFTDESFSADDEANPLVEGRLRRQDCGQITDGAAALVLASPRFLASTGRVEKGLPRITGFGHTTGPMSFAEKATRAPASGHAFPHIRRALEDAWARAGVSGIDAIDCVELHDCFSITGYMLADHLGLDEAGRAGIWILDGAFAPDGRLPLNPSGGLIGLGHPVGATGVRMLRDAALQVSGAAPGVQVEGARRAQTLNVGGSATTVVSFVVEAA